MRSHMKEGQFLLHKQKATNANLILMPVIKTFYESLLQPVKQ